MLKLTKVFIAIIIIATLFTIPISVVLARGGWGGGGGGGGGWNGGGGNFGQSSFGAQQHNFAAPSNFQNGFNHPAMPSQSFSGFNQQTHVFVQPQIAVPQNSSGIYGQGQYTQHVYGQPQIAVPQNSSGIYGQGQYTQHVYGQPQMQVPQNSSDYYWQLQHEHHVYAQPQTQFPQNVDNYYHNRNQRLVIYINGFPWSLYYPYYYSYYYPFAATQVWVWSQDGDVPNNAIVYQTYNGTDVYYCQVLLDNNTYTGVLVPDTGCYIQINDQAVVYPDYQVLVSLGY